MGTRLMLGCGSTGAALATELAGRRERLVVLSDDPDRAETLRAEGIKVQEGDPTSRGTVAGLPVTPESVVVAADDPAVNVAAAERAREAFPDAMLLAYAGVEAPDETVRRLEALADRLVDPAAATTEYLMDRVGDDGIRLRQLRRVLADLDEPLGVFTHDNPDPDAIASAVALAHLAELAGCETEVCYFGSITHQENRAFVNLLGYDLRNLEPGVDLSAYGSVALVDHSRPGVNDQLPEDTAVDVVIDHHPPRAPVDARFVDLRSDVGATSSLMVDYYRGFGAEFGEGVATGLLFGIRVDTRGFSREVSVKDFEAAAALVPEADLGTLERIEQPSMSPSTIETIAAAIRNRRLRGTVLTSCVGRTTDRDALAQAADRLLGLEDVTTTLVYGYTDEVIYVSGRTRGTDLDLGEAMREAFDQIGSGGGHADMAGAQIPITGAIALDTVDDEMVDAIDVAAPDSGETDLETVPEADPATEEGPPTRRDTIEEFVAERFYEALDTRPQWELAGLFEGVRAD